MNKKKYIEFIYLIVLGIVTSFSLSPFNYFIINFLTFTLFFLFLIKKSNQHKSLKLFFFYGWLFGLGYFASNLYWISIALTFDQNFKFLIPFTLFLIPMFLSIFYGLISYLFIILKPKKIISSLLVFSLIFGVVEFIRGSILTGFPWNLIVYSFSNELEFLSISSILGTYSLNLFCISLFISPALIILKDTKKDVGFFIFLIIICVFIYIHGINYKEKFNELSKEESDYTIRVVGSNISLERYYTDLDSVSVIQDLIKISKPNFNKKTIFIWPEGIFPNLSQHDLIEYSWLFKEHFNENHLLIIGINSQSINKGSKEYFNSFSLYDNELNLLGS